MKKQKVLASHAGFVQIILILVVIALVGGGMYYFGILKNKSNIITQTPTTTPVSSETPAKEETANWKIYKNNEFRIQFLYPPNWIVEDSSQGDGHAQIYVGTKDTFLVNFIKSDINYPMECFFGNNEYYGKSYDIKNPTYKMKIGWNNEYKTWDLCMANKDGKYTTGMPFGGHIQTGSFYNKDDAQLEQIKDVLSTIVFK